MTAPKSLVLITVDCLRADHTGYMGYARPTTPFLDSLAAESLVFPKAIVAGAPTFYSFPGIMASRFPLALGREVVGIAPGEPTLATVLLEAGKRTAAFVAANPYLSKRFGYAQGFEVFEDYLSTDFPSSREIRVEPVPRLLSRLNSYIADFAHRIGPLGKLYDELYFHYGQRNAASKGEDWDTLRPFPAADVLVDQACQWLESLEDQPFFLWLHFMDAHAPYCPSADALSATGAQHISPERGHYLNAAWNRADLGTERLLKHRDEIVCLHDAGIRWVDMQLARLVDKMRGLSLWDTSMFVQTADHGEEFLDHGGRFHYPSRAYQELLHVPLLLRIPGVQSKPLSDAPFSHINLAPTILDALGVGAPPEFEGQSYWAEAHRKAGWEYAVSESVGGCTNPMDKQNRMKGRVLAVQDRRYKLVLDFDSNKEELFDLESDPRERRALAADAEKSARARLLRTALQHLMASAPEYRRELAIRAGLHEVGLEWKHSKMDSKPLAS